MATWRVCGTVSIISLCSSHLATPLACLPWRYQIVLSLLNPQFWCQWCCSASVSYSNTQPSDSSDPDLWVYWADTHYMQLWVSIQGCLKSYVEAAAQDYLCSTKTHTLSHQITVMEKFCTYFRWYEAQLWQLAGMSDRWQKVQKMTTLQAGRFCISEQVIMYCEVPIQDMLISHGRLRICWSTACLNSGSSPSLIPVTWQPCRTLVIHARTQRPQLRWSFWIPCINSSCMDQPSSSVIRHFGFQGFLNQKNQKKPEKNWKKSWNMATWKPMSVFQETCLQGHARLSPVKSGSVLSRKYL